MTPDLRKVVVFISCPNDVSEERATATSVIEEVNRSLAHSLGFHFELLNWNARIGSGTGVGMGRPQARINPLVRKTDLFIGIFWKRFGQPTGEYESGTEEEFEIVKEKWQEHGDPQGWPEIWLYFREVDKDLLNDPGIQLQKVLRFRKELEENNICLYLSYTDPSHFEKDLRERLISLVNEFREEKRNPPSVEFVKEAIETIQKKVHVATRSLEEILPEFRSLSTGISSIKANIAGKLFVSEKLKYIVDKCLNPQGSEARAFLVVEQPGGGKSAFLAQLYQKIESSLPTVGIQCERYLDESAIWFDSLYDLIAQAQGHGPVAIIIDSLDILAAGHISKLQSWLMLLEKLRVLKGITVICACRPFEAQYVYPLSEQTWTEKIQIGLPSQEWVGALLREQLGINLEELAPQTINLLRIPLHLKLAVEIIRGGGNLHELTTVHSIYDRLLDIRNVDQDQRQELRQLAKMMADMRSISIARNLLGDFSHLQKLTATGLVIGYDPIQFIHATLFDYLIALDVIVESISLVEFLEKYGQGLFIRPALRHILALLRKDSQRLIKELEEVFLRNSGVRMHIKLAILSDIASWEDPNATEAQLLIRVLTDANDAQQLEVQFFSRNPDPHWFPLLWEPFLKPALDRSYKDGRRLRSLLYLSQASAHYPDKIVDIALELVKKPVDKQLIAFFNWTSDILMEGENS